MQNLSYWFYYKHYTECFCLVKKCMLHKHDANQDPIDIYALTYADDMLRESAFIASITSGILTTLITAGSCALAIRANPIHPLTIAGTIAGIGIIWNLPNIQRNCSHVGIMFALPMAFDIIFDKTTEKCITRTYVEEFMNEFKDDMQKYKKS